MALPSVHRCLQLSDENEQLVKKLKKLHIKNKELERNLGHIQEKVHLQQFMHDYVTSRDVQVQTEPPVWHKGGYSKDLVLEGDGVRLLEMYNELQKRYMKEIKTNQEQSKAIKSLTIKIKELEHNLQEQRQRIEQLERKKVTWKSSAASGKRSQTLEGGETSHRDISIKKDLCSNEYLDADTQKDSLLALKCGTDLDHAGHINPQIKLWSCSPSTKRLKRSYNVGLIFRKCAVSKGCVTLSDTEEELLLKEIKKLKKENKKLSAERRALKKELAGLDKDFFEEVEDLKHAVQESVKLNNQYEKCLKQITAMYGLPFTAHL